MIQQVPFLEWLMDRVEHFDALVFDIDGVLLLAGQPVPGAPAMIDFIRQTGTPFGLLTNDGDRSIPEKNALLQQCGYTFRDEELTSCADGLVDFARQQGWAAGTPVFVAGGVGNPSYVQKAGLREIRDPARLPDCPAAVIADGLYDWQSVCNALVNHCLRHPEFRLLVPNPDDVYPGHDGEVVIAAGAVARFVQQVLHNRGMPCDPIFLGKPYRPIFAHHHAALERRVGRPIDPARVLMVGDSTASDIRGARAFGYRSALLLTGITQHRHLPPLPEATPDWIFEAIQ